MVKTFNFINFRNDDIRKSIEEKIMSVYTGTVFPLIFIYMDGDTVQDRVLLRKSLNSGSEGNHILVSENPDLSLLAWKANLLAFVFIEGTLSRALQLLDKRIKSFPPVLFPSENKLKVSYKGGMELINIEEICFCSGSGNYTEIYLQNGRKKCMSYSLGEIEKRFSNIAHIGRIGKSFMINYNRVKKVRGNKLEFKGDMKIELELSSTYIKRIKRNILWY